MRRKKGIDPDQLNRPDWNDLKSNYSKHDVGEAYFVGRMHQIGLQVEHWGIDMRDDDGSGLIFDNKMDLRLWEPLDGQKYPPDVRDDFYGVHWSEAVIREDKGAERWSLRGVVDIKTKANEDWLGILNLRHFIHYCEWAREYDVPVFIYFTMVDMDEEMVGERNILIPLEPFDGLDNYIDHFDRDTDYTMGWSEIRHDCEIIERSFRAPDGNPVVQIDNEYYENFDYLVGEVL